MYIRKVKIIVFCVFALLASAFGVHYPSVKSNASEKQKGVCWVGGREVVTTKEIAALVKCNVNWISQTPFAFQRDANTSALVTNFSSDRVWWGESDLGITKTTELAKKSGIKTLLKPHIWVGKGWPGDIAMKSDSAWRTWFSNYEKFIVHYAELAEKNKIEILCIGTELHQTIHKEKEWRSLITKIKSVYKGKLTYAANFHEEYEQINFWDALDYIGIQAYFSLTKDESHSLEQLQRGWDQPLMSIERIQKLYNKPVLFTEIGYRSDKKAGIEPWTWPEENSTTQISDEAQANCYRAFFKTAWSKPWLEGAYFWKWYPHGPRRMAEIDFTPQGKPAEKVMAENFKR